MNFGLGWNHDGGADREIVRKHWPLLGSGGVVPLLKVKRTERAVENEAYRMGLKRLDQSGKRVYGGGKKVKQKKKQKNMDRSLVLPVEASFGHLPDGPAPSIWALASAIGGQP